MATVNEVRDQIKKIISIYKENVPAMHIWGKPGIGKSAMVKGLAAELELEFVDVRLGQLAPTDLRGLPIVNKEEGSMKWVAPNFLPRSGSGILFLDELNMATGAVMGLAQQLILDRRVGDYVLPNSWVIIAAGNRATDRAAVNEMPAPVANRFIHFNAEPDLNDFKTWALHNLTSINNKTLGTLIGFLNFRPELLHKSSKNDPAWPSPRTWEWAAKLYENGLDIASVVGEAAALQFRAFEKTASKLDKIDAIIEGDMSVPLPDKDPSVIYALISALSVQSTTSAHYLNSLRWILDKNITEDYAGLFTNEATTKLRTNTKVLSEFAKGVLKDKNSREAEFVRRYDKLANTFKM